MTLEDQLRESFPSLRWVEFEARCFQGTRLWNKHNGITIFMRKAPAGWMTVDLMAALLPQTSIQVMADTIPEMKELLAAKWPKDVWPYSLEAALKLKEQDAP
jgi:hypothetical protein